MCIGFLQGWNGGCAVTWNLTTDPDFYGIHEEPCQGLLSWFVLPAENTEYSYDMYGIHVTLSRGTLGQTVEKPQGLSRKTSP